MGQRWVVIVCLLAGCDLAFGLDGREPIDASPLDPCVLGSPFPAGTPVQIGDLGYGVEGARFSPDQQTAYLSLCALGQPKTTCDLYRARYFPDTRRFADLLAIAPLDGPDYDAYPTITADGRYFLWGSKRDNSLDVYVATEVNGMFPGTNLVKLAAAGGRRSNEPYILSDNRTLYFGALATGRGWDLFGSVGDGPGFGTGAALDTINSDVDDAAPVVSEDDLEIFFASTRDTGQHDIFSAIRTNKADRFGGAHRLVALSTDGIDWPLWLSPDLCTLYYINKPSETADAQLFVTSRR